MTMNIIGELKDNFKNFAYLTNMPQRVNLLSIILEKEPDVYKYVFQLPNGIPITVRVVFDFPYLTTMPVGQEIYLRRIAIDKIEISVITDRGEYLGIMRMEQKDLKKMPQFILSNGKTVKKTETDWAAIERIRNQLNNSNKQTQNSGYITPNASMLFNVPMAQMPQSTMPSKANISNPALLLPSYKNYTFVTNNDSTYNSLFSANYKVVKVATPSVTKCSCCGYDNIDNVRDDKFLCPFCGSTMLLTHNYMRNLLLNL